MPEGQVLEFSRVTKRFGAVTAVADLSVRVRPGVVTGFLGPNGAGKTTSLRMLLGQIRPSSGSVTIGGSTYAELRNPLRTVGAVLEESPYRPRRTANRQLLISAKANSIPASRVDEVLHQVGLQDDADTRLGSYSLGMRQRLAVATALLGDPGVLVLDEPANGLDPEGIRWMRLLMRRLADEGRTVLVSSHVLSEIEQVADDVVVLSKGRAVYSGAMEELADPSGGAVIVDAENRARLITVLSGAKLSFDVLRSGVTVRDSDAATVGAIAAEAGVALTLLQQRGPSLEDVFLDLVYGRRSDSPRLDEVANPVAHAPVSSEQGTAADAALVAGGVATAGAAAVVADGGMGAAAGAGYGAGSTDGSDAEADAGSGADAGSEADAGAAPGVGDADASGDAASGANAGQDEDVVRDENAAPDAGDTDTSGDDAEAAGDEDAVSAPTVEGATEVPETQSPAGEAESEHAEGDASEQPDGSVEQTADATDGTADEDRSDEHPQPEQPSEGEQSSAIDEPADGGDASEHANIADANANAADENSSGSNPDGANDGDESHDGENHAVDAHQDDHAEDTDSADDANDGDTDGPGEDAAENADAESDGGSATEDGAPAASTDRPAASGTFWTTRRARFRDDTASNDTGEDDDVDDADRIAALWAPRAAGAASDSEQGDDASNAEGKTQPGGILPLATEAVSLPSTTEPPTFTELITGIPASASPLQGDAPATEAIPVFAPQPSNEGDDDSTVDDAEDDPRLAAMRTSLSSAASRFFDGPAPDYPYGSAPAEEAQNGDSAQDADAESDGSEEHGEHGDGENGNGDNEHAQQDGDQHH